MEMEAPATGAVGSVLGSVAKEVAKGALGAVGGRAVTGLLSLVGLDSSGEAQAETTAELRKVNAELKQISAQLGDLAHAVEGLHNDLSGIHQDLLSLDRHVVDQARIERLQTVSMEIDAAERLITRLYGHLQEIPLLAAADRPAAAERLVAQILRDDQVENALDALNSNLVGVAGMERVEGTEGALELLLHAVNARIADARSRQESVAAYAVRAYEMSLAPYFCGRVGTQLQGAVLLMNARQVDPYLREPDSRAIMTQNVAATLMANVGRQSTVFAETARNLALENWPAEFLYAGTGRTPAFDRRHLLGNLLAQSDLLVDSVLGRQAHVVLRVFVSHCRSAASLPPGSEGDRQLTTEVAESLASALPAAISQAKWWDSSQAVVEPASIVPLTSWPPLSRKLLGMIYQPTGQLVIQRIPSYGIRPGHAGFLASLLVSVRERLDPALQVRDDGVALFSPELETVQFPEDDRGRLQGSLNIATYWAGFESWGLDPH